MRNKLKPHETHYPMLEEARSLVWQGKRTEGLDYLYDKLDHLLVWARNDIYNGGMDGWNKINGMLLFHPSQLPDPLPLGILTLTAPVPRYLIPNRSMFLERYKHQCSQEDLDDGLLKGLE